TCSPGSATRSTTSAISKPSASSSDIATESTGNVSTIERGAQPETISNSPPTPQAGLAAPATINPVYRHILVTRSDDHHMVTVTLNRPEQHNAMNTAMGEDLLGCFEALARDPDARAVVFTGAGDRAFCAGGDLKERNGMTDEAWRAQHVIFEQAALRVLRCPVPVIAAVEGFALAGGCELAILSDFIVAGETAVFGVPETTLGIFPGIGGTQLLPRIVGAPLAKELIFTGRRMKADEAKAAGLVNHLVPAGQARATAAQI